MKHVLHRYYILHTSIWSLAAIFWHEGALLKKCQFAIFFGGYRKLQDFIIILAMGILVYSVIINTCYVNCHEHFPFVQDFFISRTDLWTFFLNLYTKVYSTWHAPIWHRKVTTSCLDEAKMTLGYPIQVSKRDKKNECQELNLWHTTLTTNFWVNWETQLTFNWHPLFYYHG